MACPGGRPGKVAKLYQYGEFIMPMYDALYRIDMHSADMDKAGVEGMVPVCQEEEISQYKITG